MTRWAHAALAVAAVTAASCDDGSGGSGPFGPGAAEPPASEPPATTDLVVGQPVAITLAPAEQRHHRVEVVPGRSYVVAIAGATASAQLAFHGGDATFSGLPSCSAEGALRPNECVFVATSEQAYFRVEGTGTSESRAVALVAEAPLRGPTVSEAAAVPAGTFRSGQVAARSSSSYLVTGLTPGMNVTVSLLAPTGDADLYYRTDPPSSPDPCAGGDDTSAAPLSCTFAAPADSMQLTVMPGPLDRDGAHYLLLAWLGHGAFRVVGTMPSADAGLVPPDAPIAFTFSESVDPATLTTAQISITAGGAAVPGAFTADANVATFVPSSPLAGATRHEVTLGSGVRDGGGAALAPHAFGFTTRPAGE